MILIYNDLVFDNTTESDPIQYEFDSEGNDLIYDDTMHNSIIDIWTYFIDNNCTQGDRYLKFYFI